MSNTSGTQSVKESPPHSGPPALAQPQWRGPGWRGVRGDTPGFPYSTATVRLRAQKALKAQLYLLRQSGPNAFTVRGATAQDKFRVNIGPQTCTCGRRGTCIHTLFVMVRVLRVKLDSNLLGRASLKDYEVEVITKEYQNRLELRNQLSKDQPGNKRKPVDDDAECPICLTKLRSSESSSGDGKETEEEGKGRDEAVGDMIVWCKDGCGNNLHASCLKIWAEELMDNVESVTCPCCRHIWDQSDPQLEVQVPTHTHAMLPASDTNGKPLEVLTLHMKKVKLPMAAALSPAALEEHKTTVEAFGEDFMACLLSKEISLRKKAVQCADAVLSKISTRKMNNQLFSVFNQVLVVATQDKVPTVWCAAIPVLKTLFESQAANVDQAIVKSVVKQFVPIFVTKCSDPNKRLAAIACDTVLFLAHVGETGSSQVLRYMIQPLSTSSWKSHLGRLNLLHLYLMAFGRDMNTPKLESVLSFVEKCFAHSNVDVRNMSSKVTVELYKIAPRRTQRLISRLKPALKKILEVKVESLGASGGLMQSQSQLQQPRSPQKDKEKGKSVAAAAGLDATLSQAMTKAKGKMKEVWEDLRTPYALNRGGSSSSSTPETCASSSCTPESDTTDVTSVSTCTDFTVDRLSTDLDADMDLMDTEPHESLHQPPTMAAVDLLTSASSVDLDQEPLDPIPPLLRTKSSEISDWGLDSLGKELENIPDCDDCDVPATQLVLPSLGAWAIDWSDLVIEKRIGRGSVGDVYAATWHGSSVAVKVLSESDSNPKLVDNLLKEMEIISKLRHPNIVLFLGACLEQDRVAVVTQLAPKGSLYNLLKEKNGDATELPLSMRLSMAIDCCRGMLYLHSSNQFKPMIIHRDLKSKNLLVDENLRVQICDFGMSKVMQDAYCHSTAGTPQWMAPEILRNEKYDESCDVYSFGVILWELVTMQQPWNDLHPMQVVGAVGYQNKTLEIPEECNSEVSKLIQECWNQDPSVRPKFPEILNRLQGVKTSLQSA
eukprot:GFYU01001700.1.p1 GENE.GFYU01001700.1~~GFYU01001700.1.p1  ORF type:complete len:998 (-),score=251.90 GFYU01001700.1:110-3103(-)